MRDILISARPVWFHGYLRTQEVITSPRFAIILTSSISYKYDTDLGPVILSDWYHRWVLWNQMREQDLTYLSDYHDLVKAVIGTDPVTVLDATFSDNILINGRNDFNCSLAVSGQKCTPNAPLSKFHFTTGKTHILRLVNGGSDGYIITSERWPCS